jgi:hypothetical protein
VFLSIKSSGYQTFLNWYFKRRINKEKTLYDRVVCLEVVIVEKKQAEKSEAWSF